MIENKELRHQARYAIAKLLLGVVAVDVGHTITMVVLPRLHLFIFGLLLDIHLYAIIFSNQHIRAFFHRWSWRNNWVYYVVEAMNINLKLLDLADELLLPMVELSGLPSSLKYSPDPSYLSCFSKMNNLNPLGRDAL